MRIQTLVRALALPIALAFVVACTQATPGASPTAAGTAAATPAPTAAGPTGTLTVAMRGDIQSTHPYLSYDIVGISYRYNVFDMLVEWDFDGKIVPALAESW